MIQSTGHCHYHLCWHHLGAVVLVSPRKAFIQGGSNSLIQQDCQRKQYSTTAELQRIIDCRKGLPRAIVKSPLLVSFKSFKTNICQAKFRQSWTSLRTGTEWSLPFKLCCLGLFRKSLQFLLSCCYNLIILMHLGALKALSLVWEEFTVPLLIQFILKVGYITTENYCYLLVSCSFEQGQAYHLNAVSSRAHLTEQLQRCPWSLLDCLLWDSVKAAEQEPSGFCHFSNWKETAIGRNEHSVTD